MIKASEQLTFHYYPAKTYLIMYIQTKTDENFLGLKNTLSLPGIVPEYRAWSNPIATMCNPKNKTKKNFSS